jgi:hypothetical protein
MQENNFARDRIESIPQWDVANRAATTRREYLEVKLDAEIQTMNSSNDDPSIFEDAYDDYERLISGLSYYKALHILSSSPSNNFPIRNVFFGKKIITSNESWGAAKNDSGRHVAQVSNLKIMQDGMTLTKQTSKAFAQDLAGKLAPTRKSFPANDTIKSMAIVASSNLFMPKTDIRDAPLKSCEVGLEFKAAAANQEAKHDMDNLNIAPLVQKEKAQLVFSHALIYDTNFQPPLLLSPERFSALTFVGDDEITDADILSGRGGKSNHHVGNKRFRHLVSEMKAMYRSSGQKTDKTALSRGIIEYVHSYGGRFLIQDGTANDRQWRVMTTIEARKKTSQALRETKVLKWTLESSPNSLIAST